LRRAGFGLDAGGGCFQRAIGFAQLLNQGCDLFSVVVAAATDLLLGA